VARLEGDDGKPSAFAGRRFIVVLSGAATVDGTKIGDRAAIQVKPGEKFRLEADEETVLVHIGLTPVQLSGTPSDQFNVEVSDSDDPVREEGQRDRLTVKLATRRRRATCSAGAIGAAGTARRTTRPAPSPESRAPA